MEGQELVLQGTGRMTSFTARDFAAMAFRRSRTLMFCFFGILLGTLLAAIFFPSYSATTEVLLRRQRVDPAASPEQANGMIVSGAITEEELNSEVELFHSQDILRQVVLRCGLDTPRTFLGSLLASSDPEKRIENAMRKLDSGLTVEPLPKSNVIRITYSSGSPKMAAQVLTVLDDVYQQKHEEVQRTPGQFQFFDKEAEKANADLAAAEERLKAFPQESGTANPTLARDITLQKVNDMNLSLSETQAAIAESKKKIDALQQLANTTPPRLTTQMRKQDDGPVLSQMKATLLALEIKRSDLASKYQPDYPPLQELDREIADTRATISGEKPLSDITTDQNPAFGYIDSELVKSKADLRGYEAKAAETERLARGALASAQKLEVQGVEQQDLLRSAKTAEARYLLYSRKREDARITDAFDVQRILNVAIAQKPSVPSLPSMSLLMYGLIGIFLAVTVSSGTVFALEYFDPSFRTPADVEEFSNRPVLAAVPDENASLRLTSSRGSSASILGRS
jgi:uncharacterized protein involved in exopolysaccharide biosynthesis